MNLHRESHYEDHGITETQMAYLLGLFLDRSAFFIETVELPEVLGTVPCALRGPVMGDEPVRDGVEWLRRGGRGYESRCVHAPARPTRLVTVIAGPHEEKCAACRGAGSIPPPSMTPLRHPEFCRACDGTGVISHACILYTAFGGPLAPKEERDPFLREEEREASEKFWSAHALAVD